MILGISTVCGPVSMALYDGAQLSGERLVPASRYGLESLVELIDQLLLDCNASYADLSGVLVLKGPGAYTGVRLGVTVAKTIAQLCKVPVLGVPTLQMIAAVLPESCFPVLSVIPGRSGELNMALFSQAGDSSVLPRLLTDDFIMTIPQCIQFLNQFEAPIHIAGVFPAAFSEALSNVTVPHHCVGADIRAGDFVKVASVLFAETGGAANWMDVLPVYSHQAV